MRKKKISEYLEEPTYSVTFAASNADREVGPGGGFIRLRRPRAERNSFAWPSPPQLIKGEESGAEDALQGGRWWRNGEGIRRYGNRRKGLGRDLDGRKASEEPKVLEAAEHCRLSPCPRVLSNG
ncbi:hypothetical protein B296_00016756 [Ensete ventricosum]|uniref:Uncharacterized protein n=1 Tax=Ensete ventricosum TaxID=4639 RepID=A0A427B5U6_ENSVE|nr:hypothetical protein B296_00016756 [Ensete ventricosum]